MWHCSRCGETIPEDFDVCWHCGTHRDGTAAKDFQAEPDDPTVPDPAPDPAESDQTGGGENAGIRSSERPLTQEGLAAVLLRILGVYLVARGIITCVWEATTLFVVSHQYGLDFGLRGYHWHYLVSPVAELLVGIYFLVGGQWVYEKVLTPIFPGSRQDAPQETKEGDSGDR